MNQTIVPRVLSATLKRRISWSGQSAFTSFAKNAWESISRLPRIKCAQSASVNWIRQTFTTLISISRREMVSPLRQILMRKRQKVVRVVRVVWLVWVVWVVWVVRVWWVVSEWLIARFSLTGESTGDRIRHVGSNPSSARYVRQTAHTHAHTMGLWEELCRSTSFRVIDKVKYVYF